MATLTNEQLVFLKAQGVSLSLLLDASSLSMSERLEAMDAGGQKFYYGGTPCKEAGHTLRTKRGHCIQCDTSKIAYQLRSSSSGYVYFAHSKQHDYIKIGYSANDPDERGGWLQTSMYGNVNDWHIKRSVKITKDAGKCEFEIHSKLEKWRKPVIYSKNRQDVECREIFACSLAEAEAIFWEVTGRYK